MRTDIPPGLAFAQLLHAAGESSPGNLEPGTYAVALSGGDRIELEQLADKLESKGVPIHRVVESHGAYAGQLMAIGVEPGPKSVRGKHLSELPLVRMGQFIDYQNAMEHWTKYKNRMFRKKQQKRIDKICKDMRENYIKLDKSLFHVLKTWCRYRRTRDD